MRWLCVLFKLGLGEFYASNQMNGRLQEIIQYPNLRDMRSARPTEQK